MPRLVALAVACLLLPCLAFAQASSPSARPNVVIIMTDDMGWSDIGSYGAPDIKTPRIDSLARDGVKMTDFYSNGVLCTPTRAGFISGRYQQRYQLETALGTDDTASGELGLPARGHSLPQLLKNNGYATGLVGKWHLGYQTRFSPAAHGFDYFFGHKSGFIDYYQHTSGNGRPDLWENATPITRDGYMTDLITEQSLAFIERNAARPFFIDIAFNAPHWPYQRPDAPSTAPGNARHVMPHEVGAGTRQDYAAMIERVDRGVGEILDRLDRLGLAGNTIVIFTNDNGGEWLSRNAPLFHRKQSVWEGGIRVPALLRWPGHFKPGTVSSQVGITMDIGMSILAATGSAVPVNAKLEGVNLFPILEGRTPEVERTLFWRWITNGRSQRAVRSGNWKLVIDSSNEFVFDIARDIGERADLANQRQDVARRLRPLLDAWEKDVDAEARLMTPAKRRTKAAVPAPAARR